jgi:hypothetical protein
MGLVGRHGCGVWSVRAGVYVGVVKLVEVSEMGKVQFVGDLKNEVS